jgi:hypothetical protein
MKKPRGLSIERARVRMAEFNDIEEIIRLCYMLHAEHGMMSPCEPKVRELLRCVMSTGPRPIMGMVGVIGPLRSPLQAVCVMIVQQMWYTEDSHLEELFTFVHPEHRNTTHARVMIDWMKQTADETDLPLLAGIISNVQTAAKVRLYNSLLPPIGALYFYKPKRALELTQDDVAKDDEVRDDKVA